MRSLRRHVRLWAIAWLSMQAMALAVFVPRDCCTSHRPAVSAPPCHETTKVAETHAGHASGQESAAADCVIQRTCQAPAVFTILANPGVLPAASAATMDDGVATPAPTLREIPVARDHPPDHRPPRA